MIRRISIALVSGLFLGAIATSCTEDIPDCPNKLCIVAGGWKLVEVQLDGEMYTEDITNYRLVLHDPTPTTDVSSSFERVAVSGNSDTGTWSIENINPDVSTSFEGSVLRLKPQNSDLLREDWNIESVTPRTMVLVLNRNVTAKDGPQKIRFVLERF